MSIHRPTKLKGEVDDTFMDQSGGESPGPAISDVRSHMHSSKTGLPVCMAARKSPALPRSRATTGLRVLMTPSLDISGIPHKRMPCSCPVAMSPAASGHIAAQDASAVIVADMQAENEAAVAWPLPVIHALGATRACRASCWNLCATLAEPRCKHANRSAQSKDALAKESQRSGPFSQGSGIASPTSEEPRQNNEAAAAKQQRPVRSQLRRMRARTAAGSADNPAACASATTDGRVSVVPGSL